MDITTTGRQSGHPRRIEIAFHNIHGRVYVSGMPRKERRSWLANLESNPRFTLHLKNGLRADLPATARIIGDETERRQEQRRQSVVERPVEDAPVAALEPLEPAIPPVREAR